MLIGLLGFQQHRWQSVERTRRFYERTLAAEFDLRIADTNGQFSGLKLDAIVNFSGHMGWELVPHPPCTLVFALHGGPVLDYRFLSERVPQYENTDLFLVNCRSDEAILHSFVKDEAVRTARVPLPVDTALFHPQDKYEARALLPFTTDYLLGFVARLIPQKNLHGFLRILAGVKARLRPYVIHGLVIGDYWMDYPVLPYCTARYPAIVEQSLIELGLQDSVTFLPASLTDEHLALCYSAMDVLVHPTNAIDENFGYVPVEAMACGTPVVGAAYGGLKDTILHGQTGYLIPTWITATGIRMDMPAAVDAVAELIEDNQLREEMSLAAVTHGASKFSEEACGLLLRNAVRDAIQTRQARAPVPLWPHKSVPFSFEEGVSTLPDTSPPWKYYAMPVSEYVSSFPPRVQSGSSFWLAGRTRDDAGGWTVLEDPAWPARYQLDETDRVIVSMCTERRAYAPLFPAFLRVYHGY